MSAAAGTADDALDQRSCTQAVIDTTSIGNVVSVADRVCCHRYRVRGSDVDPLCDLDGRRRLRCRGTAVTPSTACSHHGLIDVQNDGSWYISVICIIEGVALRRDPHGADYQA